MTAETAKIHMLDPRRITERIFGGPHFATFHRLSEHLIVCPVNGDVFDERDLASAWANSTNLKPVAQPTS